MKVGCDGDYENDALDQVKFHCCINDLCRLFLGMS